MQSVGGISRYFAQLIEESQKYDDINCQLGIVYSKNEYLPVRKGNLLNYLKDASFYKEKHLRRWLNTNRSISLLKKNKFSIFHPTYFNTYFLKYLKAKPFVLTVFDMIPEYFPEYFPSSFSIPSQKKYLLQKAARIIAISESTKQDIIELLDIDESIIDVVYLGNGILVKPQIPQNEIVPEQFILFVGARNDYKNFNLMLKALKPLLKSNDDLYLLCCGGGIFSNTETELIADLNIKDRIIHYNNVKDEHLAYFYQNARAFIFPSLYEGFGIPILEAFTYQCPVVLSDIKVFHEIAGDAAYYFDPKSEQSIKNSIDAVIDNEKLRTSIIKKGSERVKKYSWAITSIKTKEIYQSVL
jgi:glycosyltransferase involved in cell wall biosynthesis